MSLSPARPLSTLPTIIQPFTIAPPLPFAIELNFFNIQHTHPASTDGVGMRRLAIVLLVLFCFSCAGCNVNSIENLLGLGGGKKSVTVAVTPKTQSVVVAATQQFTATVSGSTNTAVAWSVGGTTCSTQDCGSISAAGLFTAPMSIPNPALITVTATSNADSADFGAAAVTIIAAPVPATAMLRGTYTFLLSGSDSEGPLSIVGTFEADGEGQLLNGEISLCRSESQCFDQAFAGGMASSGINNGTFAADIFPGSTFTFSRSENNAFKLDLAGSRNLRASGILRPNPTSETINSTNSAL
jgi:hypothetical protein